MTADRDLLRTANTTLTIDEFAVWFAKHYQHLGRRAGSVALGISEDQYRHRLAQATRKLDQATKEAA